MYLFSAARHVRVQFRARKERTAESKGTSRFQVFLSSFAIVDIIRLSLFLATAKPRLAAKMTRLQMESSPSLLKIVFLLGQDGRSRARRVAIWSFSSPFRSFLSLKTAVSDIPVSSEILRIDIFCFLIISTAMHFELLVYADCEFMSLSCRA